MLRALVEAGITPDVIIGCSAGAINGAAFAAEPSVRGVARLERIWRKLAAGEPALMPSQRLPVAVQLARKGQSLHDPLPLATLLTEELPVADFDQLRIPFHCVATDLERAAEHWFTEGPIVPALMASASLPAVYPAHVHDGRTFIDGGVLNEVHTDRAIEQGATELYVLHVGHLDDRRTEVQRPFDSALRAYWTARRWRLEENLRNIPAHCTLHRLPSGSTPRLRFDDFTQGPDLAEVAYAQSAHYLETGDYPPSPDEPAEQSTTDAPTTESTSDETASSDAPTSDTARNNTAGNNTASNNTAGNNTASNNTASSDTAAGHDDPARATTPDRPEGDGRGDRDDGAIASTS